MHESQQFRYEQTGNQIWQQWKASGKFQSKRHQQISDCLTIKKKKDSQIIPFFFFFFVSQFVDLVCWILIMNDENLSARLSDTCDHFYRDNMKMEKTWAEIFHFCEWMVRLWCSNIEFCRVFFRSCRDCVAKALPLGSDTPFTRPLESRTRPPPSCS